MRRRDPHHEALAALAAFAGEGRFAWGEPLVATALAAELGLSPTPVREALARLAGEGLIEHRPGRGYYAPSPGADDVADLYELHRRLTHWALDLLEKNPSPLWPVDPQSRSPEQVFTEIVRAPALPVLARNHWRVTLQLRPIRRLEAGRDDPDPGWEALATALRKPQDLASIRRGVDAYHSDRIRRAPETAAEMRRGAESIVQI